MLWLSNTPKGNIYLSGSYVWGLVQTGFTREPGIKHTMTSQSDFQCEYFSNCKQMNETSSTWKLDRVPREQPYLITYAIEPSLNYIFSNMYIIMRLFARKWNT